MGIVDYKIMEAREIPDLEEKVMDYIIKGWTPPKEELGFAATN